MTGQNPRPSKYLLRVSSRVKFIISEVLHREIQDPRIGFLTILAVEPTQDLKEAKVFVSVLGSPADKSKTRHALESARGFIQRRVAQGLHTRNTPTLQFLFDDSQDKASRLEALIHKATQEDRETQMAKKPPKKPVNSDSNRSEKPSKKLGRKGPSEDEEEEGGEDAEVEGAGARSEAKDEDFEADFEADADFGPVVAAEDQEKEDVVEEEYEDGVEDEDDGEDFLDDDDAEDDDFDDEDEDEEDEDDDFEEDEDDKYNEEYSGEDDER